MYRSSLLFRLAVFLSAQLRQLELSSNQFWDTFIDFRNQVFENGVQSMVLHSFRNGNVDDNGNPDDDQEDKEDIE